MEQDRALAVQREQAPPPPAGQGEDQSSETTPDRALLSHPELTGMPRHRLNKMTDRLAESPNAAARAGPTRPPRHRTRRTAGAGPTAKLADGDRILATVALPAQILHTSGHRKLFNVDRKTITVAVAQTRPLLQQHEYTITIDGPVPHPGRPHRLPRRDRHQAPRDQNSVLIIREP